MSQLDVTLKISLVVFSIPWTLNTPQKVWEPWLKCEGARMAF